MYDTWMKEDDLTCGLLDCNRTGGIEVLSDSLTAGEHAFFIVPIFVM